MANPGTWPPLAQALDQAASGDGSALATSARATLVAVHAAPSDPPEAIVCADSPTQQGLRAWPAVAARFTRISRIGGPFVSWTGWAPCASWPPSSAHRYTGPWNVTTRDPILIVGTSHDPLTPYANARRVSRLLGNAVLLTHDGYGHTSEPDPSACVQRVTSDYLVGLQVPPPGTVCPSDRQPFDPQFGEPLPTPSGPPTGGARVPAALAWARAIREPPQAQWFDAARSPRRAAPRP